MKKYAVVVGISSYKDPDISDLHFAANDAREVGRCLRDVCGFDDVRLFVTGGDNEPDNTAIIQSLISLAPLQAKEDLFLFYFAGHGIHTEIDSYLLARDSMAKLPQASSLSMSILKDCFSRFDSASRILILDACRNDPQSGRGDEDNLLTAHFSRDILAVANATCEGFTPATCILHSCSVGQRAYEWPYQRHGAFTYYLLKGMHGEAYDDQGRLTVQGLGRFVEVQVPRWARKYSTPNPQVPWSEQTGSLREICLAKKFVGIKASQSYKNNPNVLENAQDIEKSLFLNSGEGENPVLDDKSQGSGQKTSTEVLKYPKIPGTQQKSKQVQSRLRSKQETVEVHHAKQFFGLSADWKPQWFIENVVSTGPNDVLFDQATHLYWMRLTGELQLSYAEACTVLGNMKKSNAENIGYTWHLPTIDQLLSLSKLNPSSCSLSQRLLAPTPCFVWSADLNSGKGIWCVAPGIDWRVAWLAKNQTAAVIVVSDGKTLKP